MRTIVIILACVFGATALARADPDADRFEAAKRRLEERQRATKAAALAAATRPAATRPAAASPPAVPATAPTTAPSGPRRVVFVLDSTGSMLGNVGPASAEIQKAVAALSPEQEFGVVVFGDGAAKPLGRMPLKATPANVAKVGPFLAQAVALGSGGMGPALRAAAAMKPDVIWLASDGDIGEPEGDVFALARAANPGRVPINTVTRFVPENRDQQARRHDLWRLSADSGGVCLGDDGKPIDEPAAPKPRAPRPPAPATKPTGPSIFRERP